MQVQSQPISLTGTECLARRTAREVSRPELARIALVDRPFHDGRHSAITNAAAAGTQPAALMARAGHSDLKTTQGYIDLAGVLFREEAELAERRLWGDSGTKSRYLEADPSPVLETEEAR